MRWEPPVVEEQLTHLCCAAWVETGACLLNNSQPLRSLGGLLCLMLGSAPFVYSHPKAVHPSTEVLHLGIKGVEVLLPTVRHRPLEGPHHTCCDGYVRGTVLMEVTVSLCCDSRVVCLPGWYVKQHGRDEAQAVLVL